MAAGFLIQALPWFLKAIEIAPQVVKVIRDSQPVIEAVREVAPQVLPTLRAIGAQLFPGEPEEDATEKVATLFYARSRMTFEEEQAWFARVTGDVENAGG